MNAASSYDLHLHTYWSYDACAAPETYFRAAAEREMRCIAITEHHVLDSQPELEAVAQRYPTVRWLRAGEFTVNTSLGSVDLLCFGLPKEVPPSLQRVLDHYHEWQREYGAALCKGMHALGFNYTDDDRRALLRDYRPAKTIRVQGYTHVRNGVQRAYFVRRGFVAAASECAALVSRIKQESGLPPYPEASRVVPVLKDLGVLLAQAHPHDRSPSAGREHLDTIRDECQLDGLECAHRRIPPDLSALFRAYCVEHGLFSTGGSDCHLDHEINTHFARHGGEEAWLDELLARLNP